jgi:WD40 repeat protein
MSGRELAPGRSTWRLDGHVTGAATDATSRWGAFALGSGRVRLIDLGEQVAHASREVAVHDGPVLAITAAGDGFVTGGDDGKLAALTTSGQVGERARFGQRWVEHVAALPDGRMLAAVGKEVTVHGLDGAIQLRLGPHPSTVAGLDARAGLVAVAHYGGATVHDLATSPPKPTFYPWKGSHIAVAISPDATVLASSLQDGEIHCWRLDSEREMRMAGYPGKVRSLSWSHHGEWLATSGASMLAAWRFDGDGPEGRPPFDLFEADSPVTRVACHPLAPIVAGGYAEGIVVIADVASRRGGRHLLSRNGAVSALAWSPDGRHLLAGSEDGRAAIFTIPGPAR